MDGQNPAKEANPLKTPCVANEMETMQAMARGLGSRLQQPMFTTCGKIKVKVVKSKDKVTSKSRWSNKDNETSKSRWSKKAKDTSKSRWSNKGQRHIKVKHSWKK